MSAPACKVRGCPEAPAAGIVRCAEHERKRLASRDCMRRKRARRQAAAQQESDRCVFRLGRFECGARLRPELDRRLGTVRMVCDWCERRKAGVCRECPRPVYGTVGRALRCAEHRAAALDRFHKAYVEANRELVRERARRSYQESEAERRRRAEYKRAWRKANEPKVKRQKRRAGLRQPKRVLRYMDRYRKVHREHYRQMARERYYRLNPERPAPVCVECSAPIAWEPPGRPPKRCDACVYPCERRRREAIRAARTATAVANPAFGLAPKPVKVRRPRNQAVRLEDGSRLCLTPGCTSTVSGRVKKCAPCKEAEAALARALLASRGRAA